MRRFPTAWLPDAVILEGMFMINTTPLRIHSQMSDIFAHTLCWMVPKCRSSRSTHCIWRPWTIQSTPKSHRESTLRFHSRVWAWPRGILRQIESILSICLRIPRRESLACRKCKRQLVVYIVECLLRIASGLLQGEQKLFVAGAGEEEDRDETWYTTNDGIEHLAPDLTCNAEEADAIKCGCT